MAARLKNDPYAPPASAFRRPPGHLLPRSEPKIPAILAPTTATGVPLGGIGTGGITRASDGRFSRWTLKAGGLRTFEMPANGFLLRVARERDAPVARALMPRHDSGELSAFIYEEAAPQWHGLFPMAWHEHAPLAGVSAQCLSFSPVLAGDAETSALPIAVFRWRLTNTGERAAEVSLAFSFANLNGWFGDFGETRPARAAAGCFNRAMEFEGGCGVILDRRRVSEVPEEGDGQWAIAISDAPGLAISRTVCFDGAGDGQEFWDGFLATGDAPELGESWVTESGFRETAPGHPTAAVSARALVAPGATRDVTVSLVWDIPTIRFGQGRRWSRAYCDSWGRSGTSAQALTELAHERCGSWETRIAAWHGQVADELGDAPHRAGTAINESYFLVDGLTVYTSKTGSPSGRPHFGLIECPDYALYNTLDLWAYAAEGVGRLFPGLAAGVAHDYAEKLGEVDLAPRRHRWTGSPFPVNAPGACPHDVGGPGEDPFVTPNSYTYRDSTVWKDLNCDLVLCIYREGRAMGRDWRKALFPQVRDAIDHLQQFDRDGDGLIENDGTPDQTFDNIPMTGPSSYCGGLWIAALLAGAHLAEEAGSTATAAAWAGQAEGAIRAYNQRLFNGCWFRVDTDGAFSDACFIEQLLGPFLAKRLGLGEIVPEDHARTALRNIYKWNFLEAGASEGAVTLSKMPAAALAALPHQDDVSFQTAEIQPGFNYSLAAQLEAWDLAEEADHLRRMLHFQLHGRRNLSFQTPAAFDRGRLSCRAILNMRPLSAWWMRPMA